MTVCALASVMWALSLVKRRLFDHYLQPLAGGNERLLDLFAGVAFGEDEAEVAVCVGEGLDALAGRDGDVHAGDTRCGGGIAAAADRPEDAAPRHGDHEHSGWPDGGAAGDRAAE